MSYINPQLENTYSTAISKQLIILVGMQYRNNRHRFNRGDSVTFILENDNEYDDYAVKAIVDNHHVAYVSKHDNLTLRRNLFTHEEYSCRLTNIFRESVEYLISFRKKIN